MAYLTPKNKTAVVIIILVVQAVELLLLASLTKQKVAYERSCQKLFVLCGDSLQSSMQFFSSFSESGSESDYWQGVTAFAHYIELSSILEDTNDIYPREAIYLEGKTIHGQMINRPQICKMRIEDIIFALSSIQEDITNPTVHLILSRLKNQLYEQ